MPSTITVTLAGDSAPLAAALADASTGFADMAASAGAASADMAASMGDMSASVDTASASLGDLAAASDTATASVDTAAASTDAASADMMTLGEAVDTLTAAVDGLTSSVMPLITTFGTLIAVMGAMTIINDVSSWIENLVQQMFSLDEQTQRTVNSWQYLFGSVQKGQQLAGWAYKESPNLPFTAVDLRSAVSTLGTAGISSSQIEQFMPWLADVASTFGASAYGGQGVTLSQAANAIRMATFGLSRMLRTDLGISPNQLLQYGLKGTATATGIHITDPATLIPAIEGWAKAHGLQGAAQEQETSTFWGAASSFQDYTQNILQTIGGIDPATGTVRPGSMFAGLQNLLISANTMLGQAQTGGKGPLGTIMGATGNILGGGVSGGESLLGGIVSGFGGAGGGAMIGDFLTKIKDFGQWLQSSTVQADLKKIGEAMGAFAEQVTSMTAKALPDLEKEIGTLVKAVEMLWQSMSPAQRQSIKDIGSDIIEVIGAFVMFIAYIVAFVAEFNGAINKISSAVTHWGRDLANQFRQWGADFMDMLMQGIESKLGSFGGLISRLAGTIAAKLHFSKPEEGPLADADRWMPDMMLLFEQGIERGLPGVSRAAQMAAAAIASPLHGGGLLGGGGVSNTTYSSATNYGASSPTLNMYGANQAQMNNLILEVLQALDRQHNVALQQSGGFGYRSFGPVG